MRLHLIDGTFELFRAYYSKRPSHTSPDGRELKGVMGVVASLLALLHDKEEAVTHIGVAFDNPIESFRNELFGGYKTGEGMDPVLSAQMDPVEEAVRALGVTVWSMDKWEADDALGSAAARFGGDFEQIRVLTPDKDLGQMVRGKQVVQVDRIRKKEIDEDGIRTTWGVGPESIPDLLALVGDSADGIPGLPGIGEKTAASLLGAYGHLESIPEDPSKWSVKIRGADKVAATLAAMREEALLYRRLATLALDVPMPESKDALGFRGVPRLEYEAWCDRVGAGSMKARPKRWLEG